MTWFAFPKAPVTFVPFYMSSAISLLWLSYLSSIYFHIGLFDFLLEIWNNSLYTIMTDPFFFCYKCCWIDLWEIELYVWFNNIIYYCTILILSFLNMAIMLRDSMENSMVCFSYRSPSINLFLNNLNKLSLRLMNVCCMT